MLTVWCSERENFVYCGISMEKYILDSGTDRVRRKEINMELVYSGCLIVTYMLDRIYIFWTISSEQARRIWHYEERSWVDVCWVLER